MPAVPQDNALLPFIKGYITIMRYRFIRYRVSIEEAFYRLIVLQMRTDDFRSIPYLHLGVENALRFDGYYWATLAVTVASCKFYLNAIDLQLLYLFLLPFVVLSFLLLL